MRKYQIDVQRYGAGRELTPAQVSRLVPNATKVSMSYWELLSDKLGPNGPEPTPVSILFGLSKSVARNLEDWANYLGSGVIAIIPLPLVLLDGSISLSPTGAHIVLTTNHTVLALTQEKEIKLITRVEPVHGLGISRIAANNPIIQLNPLTTNPPPTIAPQPIAPTVSWQGVSLYLPTVKWQGITL